MNISKNGHVFAFYSENIRFIVQHKSHIDIHTINDPELTHRISNVLRLAKGDKIILFDSHHNIQCLLIGYELKKNITIEILEINHNVSLHPKITWILPLLRKESFEDAIYTLTEMGVQNIQPVLTQKTRRISSCDKQFQRNKKIIISAAEQSKQFVLPILHPVVPLNVYINEISNELEGVKKIFFDASGSKFQDIIDAIKIEHINHIMALNGPEGDLTHQEKLLLAAQGFSFCALTKTVLRARQAIAVGLGGLRSFL